MGTAAISFGPKLGLLNNAAIGQKYYDQLRVLLQALDQLIMGSVINSTTVVPPVSPSNGDAYLISSTPSGAWATFPVNSIVVWDTQVTNSGTNTLNPAWVNYVPNAGWILWNTALAGLYTYTGSAWITLAGGANFPTNTDITSMTGIPNTTISTAGYDYNSGTPAAHTVIGSTGWQSGVGAFGAGGNEGAYVGNQTWTGTGASGYGVAVQSTSGDFSIISPGLVGTNGLVSTNNLTVLTTGYIVNLRIGTVGITGDAADQTTKMGGLAMATVAKPAVLFDAGTGSPTNGVGLIGFNTNYYTQTTVGSAGGASALPVTPKKYIQIVDTDGSVVVFPVYASV